MLFGYLWLIFRMVEANGLPLHGIHDKRDMGERVNTAAGVQTQQASLECSAKKGPLQARYLYGFIFLITNVLAWVTRDYAHKAPSLIQCENQLAYFLFIFCIDALLLVSIFFYDQIWLTLNLITLILFTGRHKVLRGRRTWLLPLWRGASC